jgi:hypothetical protein
VPVVRDTAVVFAVEVAVVQAAGEVAAQPVKRTWVSTRSSRQPPAGQLEFCGDPAGQEDPNRRRLGHAIGHEIDNASSRTPLTTGAKKQEGPDTQRGSRTQAEAGERVPLADVAAQLA